MRLESLESTKKPPKKSAMNKAGVGPVTLLLAPAEPAVAPPVLKWVDEEQEDHTELREPDDLAGRTNFLISVVLKHEKQTSFI